MRSNKKVNKAGLSEGWGRTRGLPRIKGENFVGFFFYKVKGGSDGKEAVN